MLELFWFTLGVLANPAIKGLTYLLTHKPPTKDDTQ